MLAVLPPTSLVLASLTGWLKRYGIKIYILFYLVFNQLLLYNMLPFLHLIADRKLCHQLDQAVYQGDHRGSHYQHYEHCYPTVC